MPVGRETFEMMAQIFVEQFLLAEKITELLAFAACGQVAENEQVGGFDERAALGQFLDWIAAIAQDAVFAVDEGDVTGAGAGVSVARVVSDMSSVFSERGEVEGVRLPGTDDDG